MKNQGKSFEKLISETFATYARNSVANLMAMPVPTRVIGFEGNRPKLVTCGKGPFDVIGYLIADARMVGAELKSSVRKASLPIVGPGKEGDGLQYHQLEALSFLAAAGGVARLVWDNGGEIGVLSGGLIQTAKSVYDQSLASEQSGRESKRGTRSLAWEMFRKIEGLDWLSPSP
jgi:hypothetical protein